MSRHIDEDAETQRLQRAMERLGKGGVSPRKYGAAAADDSGPSLVMVANKTTPEWKRKERQAALESDAREKERLRIERERFKFSQESQSSFGTLVRKANFSPISPEDAADIVEEEIVVESLTPTREPQSLPAEQKEASPPLRRNEPEPEPEPVSESTRIVKRIEEALKLSPETERRREQEQEALRNQMRHERSAVAAEMDFAAKALAVVSQPAAAKPPPTKKCGRCDKDTPISQFTCVHCGFSMMSGMFSF